VTQEVFDDPRFVALAKRDPSADGSFVYSVETTGIYCRPSCPARRANPRNVRFHADPAAAERAGFRPCKRCRPNDDSLRDRHAKTIEKLCRFIEASDEAPTLDALARRAGLGVFHLHRIFKAVTGVTPKSYASAYRARRLREALATETTVTDAVFQAGYGASATFYETSKRRLGMTPTDYRSGGRGHDIRFAVGECSLGSILVAATKRGVCAILLGDAPEALCHELELLFPSARLVGGDQGFETLVANAVGLVEDPRRGSTLPLDVRGTAFQERVWRALSTIPAGTTTTYSELARALGSPSSARAVARACATNRIAVAIPCHRVLRTDGNPAGYRWGVERKRALLAREAES
jgi:AraC family transcriptional regulator of adaptative response/methylated-DNA-[protein]-cysteine methyltransferase